MKKPVFSDDNNPIRILKGMEFSIVLDSNPTTGYSWEPAVPLDNDILILLEKSYRRPDTPRRGAGGKEIWIFRARRPGRTEIHLEYVRSWEKDRPPARTRIFKVVVSEQADPN